MCLTAVTQDVPPWRTSERVVENRSLGKAFCEREKQSTKRQSGTEHEQAQSTKRHRAGAPCPMETSSVSAGHLSKRAVFNHSFARSPGRCVRDT